MNDQQFQVLTNILRRIAHALEKIAESYGKVANPQSGNDEMISFPATSLVPEMLDGELYGRIKGGQYHKHGVRISLDVLEQAGFTVLEIKKQPLHGWMAHAVLNDSGEPEKVVWLESFPTPDPDQPV